jgi:hypothetical protein
MSTNVERPDQHAPGAVSLHYPRKTAVGLAEAP